MSEAAGITVWGRRSAFNVQKVLWALGELGLAFDHQDAGGAAGGLDAPEFRALNPHGRIPVLVDADVTIWESHAILRYLGARHGSDAHWPASPVARSHVDRWMDWSQTTLQPSFMDLFWGAYRTPEAERDDRVVDRARRQCATHFEQLAVHLSKQPFLGGPTFSFADIPAGTALHRYFGMGLDVPRPAPVLQWYARLGQRPAYREHIAVPFDGLRGRTDY